MLGCSGGCGGPVCNQSLFLFDHSLSLETCLPKKHIFWISLTEKVERSSTGIRDRCT